MAQFVEVDVDQGSDFTLDLGIKNDDGTPKNLVGYTFSSSIKKSYFSKTNTAVFLINTSQASTGNIVLSMNAATTSNIKSGRYLFDIKQKDTDNKIERVAEGIITINPQVTI